MATALSLLTDSTRRPALRHGPAELIGALANGNAPWLGLDWLASVGALPNNFAPSGLADGGEAFNELFAATGIDYCYGASISFYSSFDDVIHLTGWTEANDASYLNDWIHELVHATGHADRLGRDLPPAFGHNVHGMEDLIAEIAASIVCISLGITPRLRHPGCCPAWVAQLQSDPRAFARAVKHAREAAAYLFDRRYTQAEAYARLEVDELALQRDERARDAAVRRLARVAERGRWALCFATMKISKESFPVRSAGGSV